MPETADTVDPTPTGAEPIKRPAYSRVSRAKEGLMLRLADLGKTQTEIAQILGVSQPTVSATLAELHDMRPLAKRTLNSGAQRLAERVIRKANVAESLEVLERIQVLAPKAKDVSQSAGVTIVIGMPNQPAGEMPVLEAKRLSPPTFASDAPE